MPRSGWITALTASALAVAGCATSPPVSVARDGFVQRRRALECLRSALRDRDDAGARAAAVEALGFVDPHASLPWLRAAMVDPHPGVRFAACVTVGRLKDQVARQAVQNAVSDDNCSVRAAALFALHRLGDDARSSALPNYVLTGEDAACRRNAALVLGLLEETSAIKVLARAMKDPDFGVRQHALEAMARLGNPEARQELVFMTSSGVGSDEVFAIGALAATGDPSYVETFRYKLATAAHMETKLAAALALGRLSSADGLALALDVMGGEPPLRDDPQDPVPQQRLRMQLLAMAALGAIGSAEGLPALAGRMMDGNDTLVRVAAARATLEILKGPSELPAFPSSLRRPQD